MIRFSLIFTSGLLVACSVGPSVQRDAGQDGQGVYVRPAYQNPVPPQRIRPLDSCNSQFYRGLVNQHEGGINFAVLPLPARIVKPATLEENEDDLFAQTPRVVPFVEVRDYLPGQTIYGPSVRTVIDPSEISDFNANRITIELDAEGYVAEVRCG